MKTHGDSNKRFYHIWKHIKSRCECKTNQKYHRYGGRGIKNLWGSYEDFKEDMYSSYLEAYEKNQNISIDRINNDYHYCKDNCKWSTPIEQANNSSRNRYITYKGKTLSVSQWARELDIHIKTINSRIHILKLKDPKKILKKPKPKESLLTFNNKTQSVTAWANEMGINRATLFSRIRRGIEKPEDLFKQPIKKV